MVADDEPSTAYAGRLLRLLGADVVREGAGIPVAAERADGDPLADWARSGAMAVTGPGDGPPAGAPGHQAACMRGAARAAAVLAGLTGATLDVDGPSLLGERAAIAGLRRRGTTSPGGSARLVPAGDRWIAVNLARRDDVAALPAWLGRPWDGDPWDAVAAGAAAMGAAGAVERAQLLGIPAAVAATPAEAAADEQAAARWGAGERAPFAVGALGAGGGAAVPARPLVVDLSALWAGPLCASLLLACGARVVKVESVARPDGARRGAPAFFDLLNAGKESVAVDLADAEARAALRRLLHDADVVVESSRPRALAQLGLGPDDVAGGGRAPTWVSFTGYGRTGPWRHRVAFGDDAAVAAGIAVLVGEPGGPPMFCADAYADPVAGLHGAVAALASLAGGGGHLVDVALRDVVAHLLTDAPAHGTGDGGRVVPDGAGWAVDTGDALVRVAAPRARVPVGRAAPLGAHTDAVLARSVP